MSLEEGSFKSQGSFDEDDDDDLPPAPPPPIDPCDGDGEQADIGPSEGCVEGCTVTPWGGHFGKYGPEEVNDQVFDELELPPEIIQEVQHAWALYAKSLDSRMAAGEAIYAALFEAAPNLQTLFKTPRAVMAMRFMDGITTILGSLPDPKALKVTVETLGFQHLHVEVTVPRTCIFRDAIVDLLAIELGGQFTNGATDGLRTILNYVGGAFIFVRTNYAGRLKILETSWATANNRLPAADDEGGDADAGGCDETPVDLKDSPKSGGELRSTPKTAPRGASPGAKPHTGEATSTRQSGEVKNVAVPTTFPGMFRFNAAVMGFARPWMGEVLSSFDTIVSNVSNSYRLQEECDVLSLRMAKLKGTVNLGEYKAVMLASLRSLVPRQWDSDHEVAWTWLWENVERLIKASMGKPAQHERSLAKLLGGLEENDRALVRREVYSKFFALAPAGMDYFKQSTTRLHFIVDKVVALTLDMYREPRRVANDLSALGLRHVGYGISTELFNPYVSACVQVIEDLTDDEVAERAFRWSLNLISRILMRVISEGSTIVMRAINANSGKQLRKAVGCAPRGKRADSMLSVTVGTQTISPLLWALETGSLDAGAAIISDLLTIRADRDRYYYGMDALFSRHPDIIKRLCLDAPALLPALLDGLIWRSRLTENGERRVIYFVKPLLVGPKGQFAQALEWLTEAGSPKLVCHPAIALVTDLVWSRIAFRRFLLGKSWLLLTLLVFTLSQAVLNRLGGGAGALDEGGDGPTVRIAIFLCRCFIYGCSTPSLIFSHVRSALKDVRKKRFARAGGLRLPAYLIEGQALASLFLTLSLVGMFVFEPILQCLADRANHNHLFTERCAEGEGVLTVYSIFSLCAMLSYYVLLTGLSVFSTQVSAYVLMLHRVLAEVGLLLFALGFITMGFASGISSLEQASPDFAGIFGSSLMLVKIALGMLSGEHYELLGEYPVVLVTVMLYVVVVAVLLLNLLVAQLNCAYSATFEDMLGFARLKRGAVVVEAMVATRPTRWEAFVQALELDKPCEFGEGDIGLAGGIQVMEPASANITTVEMIRRYGGSTSHAAMWPEDDGAYDDSEDRFEKVERLIKKTMKKLDPSRRRGGGGGSSQGMSSVDTGSSLSGSGLRSDG